MLPEEYIKAIKTKFLSSFVIFYFSIIQEKILPAQGYFRARLTLYNGDFLEVAEFFRFNKNCCITESYRYQWMDEKRQTLKKRWDNVPHFPKLPNFPHHIHVGHELEVLSSQSLSILDVIDLIELEFYLTQRRSLLTPLNKGRAVSFSETLTP